MTASDERAGRSRVATRRRNQPLAGVAARGPVSKAMTRNCEDEGRLGSQMTPTVPVRRPVDSSPRNANSQTEDGTGVSTSRSGMAPIVRRPTAVPSAASLPRG